MITLYETITLYSRYIYIIFIEFSKIKRNCLLQRWYSWPMQGRLDNASVNVFLISNSSHSQGRLMQNFEIDIN